ncbi:hypothetical protein J2T57_000613 [Natronocella acetinitrilica]|uniref:BIG2 domain-containing protein n=1 Tax=Natronocella acetinitrilica TaxID=414046 RepID=A0AAE3KAK4_9GAMM|nr:Ig-like domain-containing protein [Natronocella acetinitrilica]MCP1673521.1 hypothetical protein [Natronocella acetinitrilica]
MMQANDGASAMENANQFVAADRRRQDGGPVGGDFSRWVNPLKIRRLLQSVGVVVGAGLLLAGCFGGSGGGGGSSGSSEPSLVGLEASPPLVQVPVGFSEALTVTAQFDDGSSREVTDEVAWSSADETIATVPADAPARVRGEGGGETVLEARFEDQVALLQVEVSDATLEGLEILWLDEFEEEQVEPVPPLAQGQSIRLVVRGVFEDGSSRDLTRVAQWESADPDAVSVGAVGDQAGLVTGRRQTAPESVNVTATVTAGDGPGEAASAAVTVTDAVVDSISISPGMETVNQSGIVAFGAVARLSDDTTVDVTTSVTWSVDAPDIATIRNTAPNFGRAAGLQPGNTTVKAILGGDENLTDTAFLEVLEAPAAPRALRLEARPNVILAGGEDTTELTATVFPNVEGRTIVDGTPVRFVKLSSDVLNFSEDGMRETFSGVATLPATGGSLGIDLVFANVPDTIAEGLAFVRVVDSFAEVVVPLGFIQRDDDGNIEAYIFAIGNVSNRQFEIDGVDVFDADGFVREFDAEELDQLNDRVLLGRGQVAAAFGSLDGRDPDDVSLTFLLREPSVPGSEFEIEVVLQ